MLDQPLAQLLRVLVSAGAAIVAFQLLHEPSSLGYLLVDVMLDPQAIRGRAPPAPSTFRETGVLV